MARHGGSLSGEVSDVFFYSLFTIGLGLLLSNYGA